LRPCETMFAKKITKNRKTKEKECTTLASGLGVVPYMYIKKKQTVSVDYLYIQKILERCPT
jgi:hypothetical protein